MTVLLNHRTTTLTTHLNRQTIRIGAVSCMTVKATSRNNGLCDNSIFTKGTKFPLIDSYVTSYFIARFDTTIGKSPVIKTGLTYKYIKIFVLGPLSIFLYANCHRQLTTLILLCQRMPFINIKISPITVHMKFAPLAAFYDDIHTIDRLVGKIEIQGGDIGRNRHTSIVWINSGLLTYQCGILGAGTARQLEHRDTKTQR